MRIHKIVILVSILYTGPLFPSYGGEKASPPLLSDRTLPPPRPNPDSSKLPQPRPQPLNLPPEANEAQDEEKPVQPRRRSWLRGNRAAKPPNAVDQPDAGPMPEKGESDSYGEPPADLAGEEPKRLYDTAEAMAIMAESGPPPTPQAVEDYRMRLEGRLLEKYNNIPEYGGQVARVDVILSRPLETSMDGTLIRAEFDQLVYDQWGKRLPALEREYYVATFGSEGVRQVRSDPSIRIGLDMEKTYSERAPLAADPFRAVPESEAFAPAPRTKMPGWWRPEFPELD